MKRCNRCGAVKPLSEFHRALGRRDGVQTYCKRCRSEIDHARYERRVGAVVAHRPRSYRGPDAAWLRGLKVGRPCTDCAGAYPPEALQWDHLPGTDKIANISDFRGTKEEILKELEKCELVCANCHAVRTYTRARATREVRDIHEPFGVYLVRDANVAWAA